MENNKTTDVQIICNTSGRLDPLKSIFELLHKNKVGKYTSSYYSIDSHIKLNQVRTNEDIIFNRLQQDAHAKGIKVNCFSLNINL